MCTSPWRYFQNLFMGLGTGMVSVRWQLVCCWLRIKVSPCLLLYFSPWLMVITIMTFMDLLILKSPSHHSNIQSQSLPISSEPILSLVFDKMTFMHHEWWLQSRPNLNKASKKLLKTSLEKSVQREVNLWRIFLVINCEMIGSSKSSYKYTLFTNTGQNW